MVFLRGSIFQKPFCRGNQGRCFGSPLLVIGIDCWGFLAWFDEMGGFDLWEVVYVLRLTSVCRFVFLCTV